MESCDSSNALPPEIPAESGQLCSLEEVGLVNRIRQVSWRNPGVAGCRNLDETWDRVQQKLVKNLESL
jgi:hypothetical protein